MARDPFGNVIELYEIRTPDIARIDGTTLVTESIPEAVPNT